MNVDYSRQVSIKGVEAHFLGVDIGKMTDHSALAIVARRWEVVRKDIQPADIGPLIANYRYYVVFLRRLPLGTPYEELMQQVEHLWRLPELLPTRNFCVVDQTGVGAPIVEALRRRGVPINGIIITAGQTVTQAQPNEFHVGKADIVSQFGRFLQAGRIQVLETVEAAKEFGEEAQSFGYRLRRDTGVVQYEAMDEQVHDDLILSVALPIWFAEHVIPPSIPGQRRRGYVAKEYEPLGKRR